MLDAEGPIRLAEQAPFRLGALLVRPALRVIELRAETRVIEPRLMQVLIALGREPGRIISRDSLVATCWDGRIVGDNAINRAISLLRALGAETGAFQVQTIKKVGYRLVPVAESDEAPPDTALSPAPARPDRRALLLGAAATVAVGGTWAALLRRNDGKSDAAKRLVDQALSRARDARPELKEQNIADVHEALRLAPDYARAWGVLALIHAHDMRAGGNSTAGQALTAARRALAIDPGEPHALVARLRVRPLYGQWREYEMQSRQVVRRTRDHPEALSVLAEVLQEVGRWRESEPLFGKVSATLLSNPIGHYKQLLALWGSGQTSLAEVAAQRALGRFPRTAPIWQTWVKMLILGGRPEEAIRLIEDERERPDWFTPERIRIWSITAHAVASGSRTEATRAVQALTSGIAGPGALVPIAHCCAVIGASSTALDLLEAYFRSTGRYRASSAGDVGQRWTSVLFQPMLAPIWRELRFAHMLELIGLSDYWSRSGTRPDFEKLPSSVFRLP